MPTAVRRVAAGLADLVWPRVCAVCGIGLGPGSELACFDCAAAMAAIVGEPYCVTCGDTRHSHLLIDRQCAACRDHKPAYQAYIRVGRYAGPLRSLVLRFKREFVLDRYLGDLLGDAVLGAGDRAVVDCWTPVPSPLRRRVLRGFQPTRLLAEAVGRHVGRPVAPLLAMNRYVRRLHGGMTATERAEAVRGAFRAADPRAVAGRTIGVIDDVSTTGATLAEARRALREAGAKRVVVAILARTRRD